MITEFLDLKLLVGTLLSDPEKIIIDEKQMDEWQRFRDLLRGEDKEPKEIKQ